MNEMRVTISPLIVLIAFVSSDLAGSDLKSEEVYSAWLQMYDLKFQDAHIVLERWQKSHPDDSLGPASDAAAYLFSELTRLRSEEHTSELQSLAYLVCRLLLEKKKDAELI